MSVNFTGEQEKINGRLRAHIEKRETAEYSAPLVSGEKPFPIAVLKQDVRESFPRAIYVSHLHEVIMSRGTYSGEEIIKVLHDHGFLKVNQSGSHVKLKYTHPKTGEKRIVIVPLHDELNTGTLRDIADQVGANDFQSFLDWVDSTLNR